MVWYGAWIGPRKIFGVRGGHLLMPYHAIPHHTMPVNESAFNPGPLLEHVPVHAPQCGGHGIVVYGMVWYGMVWHGGGMVWYGMVCMVWYGMVW